MHSWRSSGTENGTKDPGGLGWGTFCLQQLPSCVATDWQGVVSVIISFESYKGKHTHASSRLRRITGTPGGRVDWDSWRADPQTQWVHLWKHAYLGICIDFRNGRYNGPKKAARLLERPLQSHEESTKRAHFRWTQGRVPINLAEIHATKHNPKLLEGEGGKEWIGLDLS